MGVSSRTVRPPAESAALYSELAPALNRVAALMLGCGAAAEDVVHDCFIRFGSASRPEVVNPAGYLRRMVVREALRVARQRSRETLFREPPERTVEATIVDVDLYRALGELTPRRRAAVILRYLEDMAVGDVAAVLNCTPTTASSLIRRALADLRTNT